MKSRFNFVLLILVGFLAPPDSLGVQQAWTQPEITQEAEHFTEYYTINDQTRHKPGWKDPNHLIHEGLQDLYGTKKGQDVRLMDWLYHPVAPPRPSEDYDRKKHFGTWVNDPTDDTCFNTRAKVLVRDSKSKVLFDGNDRCSVYGGKWNDPYTGGVKYLASDVQIDHLVPLKHAYVSGAFKWSAKKRCLYANFLANGFHLLPVDATENMKKSDRGPDQYMPPNSRYVCRYLSNWLKVKAIWKMIINPKEAIAIEDLVEKHHCEPIVSIMSREELDQQRKQTTQLQEICQNFGDSE